MAQDIRCTIHDSDIPCAKCLATNNPDSKQEVLPLCPFCGERLTMTTGRSAAIGAREFYNPCCQHCDYVFQVGFYNIEDAIKACNSRASVAAVEGDAVRLIAAEGVANAARQFCEELQEDAEGVPQLQLSKLNEALDAWEAYPDARESFDDSQPVMAALASLIEDEHATDHQRRVARLALTTLESHRDSRLTELERNEVGRAIAESDIAGCTLENADIDALVDLFEAWLERRAAASSPAPAEVPQSQHDRFRQHLDEASAVVATWEPWERNIFGDRYDETATAPAEPEGEQEKL